MRLDLRRSARRDRFLNTRHGWPLRLLAGALGGAGALSITGEPRLGAEMFRRLCLRDDFRLGVRRASWYARRGWPGLDASRDPVFVFCHGMDAADLAALRRFLLRRGPRDDPGRHRADLAYVSALAAIRAVGTPGYGDALARFAEDADRLLDAFADHPFAGTEPAAEGDEGEFSADRAQAALGDAADLLGRQGLRWFILSGTLLGVVREGGFLAHDHDIDLGIMAEDADIPRLREALAESPLFHVGETETQTSFERGPDRRLVVREHPVFLSAGHVGGVQVDIFVHHREGDAIWHGSGLLRWENAAFDLAPYALGGVPVLGPADADRYLTENYGDWRKPKVAFNSATDTTNQGLAMNPLSVAMFLRRGWARAARDPEGASALLGVLRRAGFLAPAPGRALGLRVDASGFAP